MPRSISLDVAGLDGSSIQDPLLDGAHSFRKSSQYPAGLYGPASFVVPREVGQQPTLLEIGQEIRVRLWDEEFWASDHVYHGYVQSLEEVKRGETVETRVGLVGAWGWIMETTGIERRWADTRLGRDVWVMQTSANGSELAQENRESRIRITPKGVAWPLNATYQLLYTMPTGELVGRVENDFDFQEAAQDWRLRLNEGDGTQIWSKTASASGSEANNLTTPDQVLSLIYTALTGQTPTEGGAYYGEISNVIVYAARDHASATLGNVNAYEIALDILHRLGVDETRISANAGDLDSTLTLDLVPFITKGHENFAAILARAAGYGTSARKSIGFGLRPPFLAPDNLPMLFVEPYPTLDAVECDYEASVDDIDLSLRLNGEDVLNWIPVEYTNRLGNTKTLTPDDDADLTDADSVEQYGERRPKRPLSLPLANDQQAKNFGTRFLARHKQPTYVVTRPVTVSHLTAKNGGDVPAGLIDAGQRLRIVDLQNLIGQEGPPQGITLMITATQYDHDKGVVDLSLGGRPDNLVTWLAQMELGAGNT